MKMNLEKVADQTTACAIGDGKSAKGALCLAAFMLKVRSIMSQSVFSPGGSWNRPQRISGSLLFPAMFRQLVAVATKLRSIFSFKISVGYEDESGFNYGVAPKAKSGCRPTFVFAVVGGMIAAAPFQALASQNLTLSWQASSSPSVTGYNIYYGSQLGNYTNMISVGNVTSATVSGLNEGVCNYFVVTAIDTFGLESLPSNEVAYTIPNFFSLAIQMLQGTPAAVLVTSTGTTPANWVLESSSNLTTWTTAAEGTNTQVYVSKAVTGSPTLFFRLRNK